MKSNEEEVRSCQSCCVPDQHSSACQLLAGLAVVTELVTNFVVRILRILRTVAVGSGLWKKHMKTPAS